ncbi:ABC transporter permease [Paenibacillus aceris]|uniref:Peptide/nickel transport system permease protein n=1 Tax=Paenibacillus aceris TaxID=869555 RepID=A0ABS4I242_9BACL|nr:ABC transporter permease [Paenibacillus aceris]MBP1964978.1 peptide/nickel transport system permease protein [Paenibacillus aceris]NHW35639.1 ABC transporter permease [Paenibacillus aceris]
MQTMKNVLKASWSAFPGTKGKMGLVILLIFTVIALFGSWFAPSPRNFIGFESWLAPSFSHWLGTDSYGQDVLSQMIYGTRTSFWVGILAGLITTVIGVTVGVVSGFKGGWIEESLMRIVDLFLIIPTLALMIILASFLPSMGTLSTIVIIGSLSWLYMGRSIRSQTMSERQSGYVEAARMVGMKDTEIMFREILPNIVPVILANLVLVTTQAVLAEAGLSFLGLGDPTNVSWGTILALANANNAVLFHAWWWILPPGLAIAFFCFGFILIGNGILEKYRANRGNAAL